MIYLDYSANTPCDPQVLQTLIKTEEVCFGNPNSKHPAGRVAAEKLAEVTAGVRQTLGLPEFAVSQTDTNQAKNSAIDENPSDIIWTSGASEANNLAIKGIARTRRHIGKHIISTPLEHPSVSGPLTWLKEQGYEIDLVDIGRDGKIDTDHLKELLREDTILIAVCAVDSELGVVQPVKKIAEIASVYPNCALHVDATQAIGKIPFSFDGVDTASLAAHKIYGPNGIGLLYKKEGLVLDPIIHGGTGASLYRSGTPTVALAAAMEKALILAMDDQKARFERVQMINLQLRTALSAFRKVRINSPTDAIPHILNLSVNGVKGTEFQKALAEQGVCVSVKSACSVEGTPSRAVFAVSRDRKNALASWRISLSHLTAADELRKFMKIFEYCYDTLAGE